MLCIIGCGNSTRSDDGVGVYVAQSLRAVLQRNPRSDTRVFDAGTGGMDVMFQARGARQLIIVDASRSGADAGAIFKIPGDEVEAEPGLSFSLHDFRWQHALHAGRKIFGADFPKEVTVFLVEARSLDFGLELTAPVAHAAERVIHEILSIMSAYPNVDVTNEISAARGNLYLSREICEAYLPGVVSVALLSREDTVLIVPLTQASAGGLLLKQRNVRGDRVIHAQEFFRSNDLLEDFEPRTVSASWSANAAALVVSGLPPASGAGHLQ